MALGEKLKSLRKQCAFTQQQISDALGIDRSTYAYYESNTTQPNVEALKKLAQIFNVSVDYLVGYEGRRSRSFVVNDDPVTQEEMYDFSIPCYASELSSDERELLLYYRAIDNQKAVLRSLEKRYFKELELHKHEGAERQERLKEK